MSKAYDTAQQAMQDGLDTTHFADGGDLCQKLVFQTHVKAFQQWYWIEQEGEVTKEQAYIWGVHTAKENPSSRLPSTVNLLTAIGQA